MTFFVSMEHFVDEPSSFHEAFEATFYNMVLQTISLSVKVPGTNYYRGLQVYIYIGIYIYNYD